MNWKNWSGTATFWRTLPTSSFLIFLAAVFCLLASLGFILDSRNPHETTASELAINVVTRSCFAVCWAILGTRKMFKSMIPLAILQVFTIWLLGHVYAGRPNLAMNPAEIRDKLRVDSTGTLISVIAGYGLFLLFFGREGKRFFAAHTEIRLAAEIHRSLVPQLSFKSSGFEFFGVSFPSGNVAGDLVDVIAESGRWFAYVADVAGHGVPAGILMSMTKSAVRTWLASRAQESALLRDINRILKPLLMPNMFVTFAYAAWDGSPDLAFSSAGHVPLLHYQAQTGQIEPCSIQNFPLGILPDEGFGSGTLRLDCGDMLAIVSDGFTETFDSKGREFGLTAMARILESAHNKELSEISTEVRERVRHYGEQRDDQTILLIRRLA